jgi:hypothetical protein
MADGQYYLKRPLQAHQMSTVMIELTFMPAIHRTGEELIADVIFTDNYGDEHRVPSVRFPRGGLLTGGSPLTAQLARS